MDYRFDIYKNINQRQRSQTLQPIRGCTSAKFLYTEPEKSSLLLRYLQSYNNYGDHSERANYANVPLDQPVDDLLNLHHSPPPPIQSHHNNSNNHSLHQHHLLLSTPPSQHNNNSSNNHNKNESSNIHHSIGDQNSRKQHNISKSKQSLIDNNTIQQHNNNNHGHNNQLVSHFDNNHHHHNHHHHQQQTISDHHNQLMHHHHQQQHHLHQTLNQHRYAPPPPASSIHHHNNHNHHHHNLIPTHQTNHIHHTNLHNRSQSQHYYHTTLCQNNDPNNYYNLSNIGTTIIPAHSGHHQSPSPVVVGPLPQASVTNAPLPPPPPQIGTGGTGGGGGTTIAFNDHLCPTSMIVPPSPMALHNVVVDVNGSAAVHHQQHNHHNPNQQVAKLDDITIMQICNEFVGDIDQAPPLPSSRQYTISANKACGYYKIGFPQKRYIRSQFTDIIKGVSLAPGTLVSVLCPSKEDRSKFTVCFNDQHIDLPHQLTYPPQLTPHWNF